MTDKTARPFTARKWVMLGGTGWPAGWAKDFGTPDDQEIVWPIQVEGVNIGTPDAPAPIAWATDHNVQRRIVDDHNASLDARAELEELKRKIRPVIEAAFGIGAQQAKGGVQKKAVEELVDAADKAAALLPDLFPEKPARG